MAKRRMISAEVVCSDTFSEMPFEAQALYYRLIVAADDDGFLNCARTILRILSLQQETLSLLESNGYIYIFDSGIVCIRHWNRQNTIQKDRYSETAFQNEKSQLVLREKTYYLKSELETITNCIQDVSNLDTQYNKNNKLSNTGKERKTYDLWEE